MDGYIDRQMDGWKNGWIRDHRSHCSHTETFNSTATHERCPAETTTPPPNAQLAMYYPLQICI